MLALHLSQLCRALAKVAYGKGLVGVLNVGFKASCISKMKAGVGSAQNCTSRRRKIPPSEGLVVEFEPL